MLTKQATEQDSFEDAVDAVSVRSLTKRTVSVTKPPPPNDIHTIDLEIDQEADGKTEKEDTTSMDSDYKPEPQRESTPLSHRISSTSNLDNVSLDDDTPQSPGKAPCPVPNYQVVHVNPTDDPIEPTSPIEKDQPSKTISLSSITNALPPLPWSPPAEVVSKSSVPLAGSAAPPPTISNPPPPTRKLTSPFSWLSRNTSSKDKEIPPTPPVQATARRNTASSIATLTSNPEMMLSKLEEEREGDGDGTSRNSLKDRFKVLRMQQEAGIILSDDDRPAGARASASNLCVTTGEDASVTAPPLSPVPTPITDLAPGTVAGVNAGPSALAEAQVDWDLWQSVVYEGPAAVARTSAEELNKAIATGIPSAIRGVIWQVLAQSKNEDLELVYKDLILRGAEKNKDRNSNSTTASTISNGSLSVRSAEGVTSSASSVHSEQSSGNSSSSYKGEKSNEANAKAQAAAVAERKRKEKEDILALQKLEKVIRRDLGTRTSYSKYAAAAGLQDGLFGVCKAYALFDEGVGYAQGMNFLIMPILFNVTILLQQTNHSYQANMANRCPSKRLLRYWSD